MSNIEPVQRLRSVPSVDSDLGDDPNERRLQRELEFRRARKQRVEIGAARSPRRAYDLIRSSIRVGVFPIGSRLDEGVLVDSLQVSRTAVREALTLLAGEGFIERRQRTGTIVVRRPLEAPLDRVRRTGELPVLFEGERGLYRADDIEVARVDSVRMPLPRLLRKRLTAPSGDILVLTDIVSSAGVALGVRTSYMDAAIGPDFEKSAESRRSFLLEHVTRVSTVIEAIASDARIARLLDVPEGAAIIVREISFADEDGHTWLLSQSAYRGDRITVSSVTDFTEGAFEGSPLHD